MVTMRDIDYAAQAVRTAMVGKFGRQDDLSKLTVEAQDRTILIKLLDRDAEGTRDDLMAAVRKAPTLSEFWDANR